jgi:gamma-glutamyltranspeptidase / glutathione hydrolase
MIELDWRFPYPSQRMPVMGRNVVATSQPLAAQAGLSMMQRGGNAIDAAIAAAAALTVTEPTSNGLGSDAFALIWHDGRLHGLNGSGRSPAAMTAERFIGLSAIPTLGWDAVTVPGAISAWDALHERFGSLPFGDLIEPAIRLARDGFLVAPQTSEAWAGAKDHFRDFPAWQATFAPGGRTPAPGELVRLPDHASTLEKIAETRGEAFYRGDLARAIASAARDAGALLTEDDLAGHQCDWVDPLALSYRTVTLHELPPNGQGIAAQIALGILQHFDLAGLGVDSAAWLHVQIEAMKLGFADAHRYIADPKWMDVDPRDLLRNDYLASRAALIDMNRAQDFGHGMPKPGGTVLLITADQFGNMVSFIQSNYMGFGSGIVIPGTGIALQNRGANFSLEPGHPNLVAGGKRPYHTIIPGFVTRQAQSTGSSPTSRTSESEAESRQPTADSPRLPLLAFGVMGGFMQPQGHVQMMVRIFDHHQNPQTALDGPRWRVEARRKVVLEPGFPPQVADELQAMGHHIETAPARTVAHGGGQAILRLPQGYLGASDPRRDGQAVAG